MRIRIPTVMNGLAVVLVAMMLTGTTLATLPNENVTAGPFTGQLLEKADPELVAAILSGQTTGFEVIATAHPHEGITARLFTDRAAAMDHLDARAAPFFAHVDRLVATIGGNVEGTWSAAPAIKVSGDLSLLVAIAAIPEVHHLALDHDEALGLVSDVRAPRLIGELDGQNSQGRNMIQAEDAWALGYEGEGITISVIDTGVDPTHEAFKHADGTSRLVAWANCITGSDPCDSSGTAFDDESHGTHVAATALGSSVYNDTSWGNFEETGVAPKANLMAAKFLNSAGSGSTADGMKALQWSFDNGADITSNSWGGSCSAATGVLQLVNQLTDLGMVNVFAAGNSGPNSGTVLGPACADKAINVGAVDHAYVIAGFSSRGPCSDPSTGTGPRICPDVVAKGVSVRSAVPRSGCFYCDPSGYATWGGTSMATPHVAGAIALAEEMKRDLTGSGWNTASEAEKEVLKMTALDLGPAGPDNTYGWGHPQLLNIHGLLSSMDEANIVSNFAISNAVIRQGDTTTLSFGVRNLGGVPATGDFLATLEHPDGTLDTLRSSTVTLALLDGESSADAITATSGLAPGVYTFTGTFDYTWVDPDTNDTVTGAVHHDGTFEVVKVFIEFATDGLEPQVSLLELQSFEVEIRNMGNEEARATVLEFTVSDAYLFFPPGTYSSPPPDRVHRDETFGRTTLVYDVGTLAEADSFAFGVTLLAMELGDHNFIAAVKFQDGAGNGFTHGEVLRQTVGLPLGL